MNWEGRAKRRADLDDRPLAPDGGAAAYRYCRSEGLDQRHCAADIAALVEDRIHHFGDAVPFCLRGKALHKKNDNQASDDRGQQNEVAEPAGALADIGVINEAELAVIRHVVHEGD